MTSFELALQTRVGLPPHGDPTEFVSEYVGLIRKYTDDSDTPISVGKIKAIYIHVGLAMNARMSLYDICDDHSDELHRLHARLFVPGSYDFRRSVGRHWDAMGCDVLVVDYLALDPKWRGMRLGLLAVRQLIDVLAAGCALVVSEILPLGPEAPRLLKIPRSWVPVHKSKEELRVATKKLRRYFRQVGFNRVGHSSFYALSVSKLATPATDLLKAR
jgi:hypothetical protein